MNNIIIFIIDNEIAFYINVMDSNDNLIININHKNLKFNNFYYYLDYFFNSHYYTFIHKNYLYIPNLNIYKNYLYIPNLNIYKYMCIL